MAFGAAKAKKNNLKNLEFRLGDLQNPPIEPESVDLVILSQALHHAEDPAKAIRSAFSILKPGGQIMILDLARHSFRARARALRRPLARFCRKRPAPLARGGRLQEDRNQRRRPRRTAPAFRDRAGRRAEITRLSRSHAVGNGEHARPGRKQPAPSPGGGVACRVTERRVRLGSPEGDWRGRQPRRPRRARSPLAE